MNIEKTYCNPTPLPDYPIGRTCFYRDPEITFRETADPSVIYEDGKWYLYSSCGMAYWSEDFIHWNHEKLDTYDIGYAPTIVKHKGKFLLTACSAGIYIADNPLGPFTYIDNFRTVDGEEYYCDDPMLFSDDDDRLYLYSGCGGGIKGVELDADKPNQLLHEPKVMFDMDTENHVWERMGDCNQDGSYSWTEGAWMYKRNGIYYLTYSGPGTEWATYAMGAYKGTSPMGPWTYMETSPFLSNRHGLVRGPGHGSIVDGPNGTVWAFYTCTVCYASEFERRIGYDPIWFDENGDIIPTKSSETPQWCPVMLRSLGRITMQVLLTLHRTQDVRLLPVLPEEMLFMHLMIVPVPGGSLRKMTRIPVLQHFSPMKVFIFTVHALCGETLAFL